MEAVRQSRTTGCEHAVSWKLHSPPYEVAPETLLSLVSVRRQASMLPIL